MIQKSVIQSCSCVVIFLQNVATPSEKTFADSTFSVSQTTVFYLLSVWNPQNTQLLPHVDWHKAVPFLDEHV